MRFNHLNDWLAWQERLNPAEIDLGLDRVGRVLAQAKLFSSFDCPLITVAGTNGKGSVVAMLEAIAMAAGLKVCSYTSPHLFLYNERIKINGQAVDDNRLCEAFERIDQARDDNPLTYFEFGTLAAIDLFFREQPDLVILEVGLGGRLDAVNVMHADVCILTSIAIDHVDWLGDNRESIGYEKAGIFRSGKTVICGEVSPPESVIKHAQELHCEFIQLARDYDVLNAAGDSEKLNDSWSLQSCYGDISALPQPSLSGEFQKSNAATAILALQALLKKDCLLLTPALADGDQLKQAVTTGLKNINLSGRFQQINTDPQVYVDVAHNPQAAQALASQLKHCPPAGQNKTWAIVAMLSDKDVAGVIGSVSASIDFWCFAGLEDTGRGLSVDALISSLSSSSNVLSAEPPGEAGQEFRAELRGNQCTILPDTVLRANMVANTVASACKLVLSKANKNDRIIVFGSFYTVSEAMLFFSRLKDEYV